MKARNYAGIRCMMGAMAAAMGFAAQHTANTVDALGAVTNFSGAWLPARRRTYQLAPALRKAGNKVLRECYQGRATMKHLDGSVAATVRETQTRKNRAALGK